MMTTNAEAAHSAQPVTISADETGR